MSLDIRIAPGPDVKKIDTLRVVLAGRLDTATAPELEKHLAEHIGEEVKVVIFDMTDVDFVTSAGIRIVMATRKKVAARGGQCVLTNLQPQVDKVFEIAKAVAGMSVFKNQDEEDRYLAAIQRKVLEGDGGEGA